MSDFDKSVKIRAAKEQTEIPGDVKERLEQTLADLPETNAAQEQTKALSRIVAVAACAAFITIFLLPNVSVNYAKAIGEIPIIGSISKVVTIRNYICR